MGGALSKWYRNDANAIIIDDRGVGVLKGGKAFLSKPRAEAIRSIRPGSLPELEEKESNVSESAKKPKREEKPEKVEPEQEAGKNPVERALDLHWKKRIKIAESMGSGEKPSRRAADRFLKDLEEAAWPALLSEVESLEG